MVDLYFADAAERKRFDCVSCQRITPNRAAQMKCKEPSFLVLPERQWVAVGKYSNKYPFCPGKAKWYPKLAETFEQCIVAAKTGILPDGNSLQDQSQLFVECFPTFIEKYQWRWYARIWDDVGETINKVFESVSKMFSKKKK